MDKYMENVNEAVVVKGNRFYTDTLNSCYDEFLRLKPDYNVLGNTFFMLLQDATLSLVKSIAKSSDNTVLQDNTDNILKLTDRYARLYFSINKSETSLLMFRSALYDLIRCYDRDNRKYDTLVHNMYESIRKLITV
jgi:hypothetical protein